MYTYTLPQRKDINPKIKSAGGLTVGEKYLEHKCIHTVLGFIDETHVVMSSGKNCTTFTEPAFFLAQSGIKKISKEEKVPGPRRNRKPKLSGSLAKLAPYSIHTGYNVTPADPQPFTLVGKKFSTVGDGGPVSLEIVRYIKLLPYTKKNGYTAKTLQNDGPFVEVKFLKKFDKRLSYRPLLADRIGCHGGVWYMQTPTNW